MIEHLTYSVDEVAADTFQVGKFKCTMTITDGAISAEWSPYMPKRLKAEELAQYRKGRDAFAAQVAGAGKKVLVVEV
jgi:hypothetical protein